MALFLIIIYEFCLHPFLLQDKSVILFRKNGLHFQIKINYKFLEKSCITFPWKNMFLKEIPM